MKFIAFILRHFPQQVLQLTFCHFQWTGINFITEMASVAICDGWRLRNAYDCKRRREACVDHTSDGGKRFWACKMQFWHEQPTHTMKTLIYTQLHLYVLAWNIYTEKLQKQIDEVNLFDLHTTTHGAEAIGFITSILMVDQFDTFNVHLSQRWQRQWWCSWLAE